MKKCLTFIKQYGYDIVRFFVNQIIMSFLGVCVGLPTIIFDNIIVSIIGCCFTVFMLCFLQYDFMFQLGEKHCYSMLEENKPKKTLGMKIGLIGSIPAILVSVLGLIFRLAFTKGNAASIMLIIYYIFNGAYLQSYALVNVALQSLNQPLLSGCICWGFCLLFIIPSIVSSFLGYYLGSIDKPLRTFFGIKVKPYKTGH